MAYSRTYIPGDRLVDCDICGFTYRSSQMRKGVSGNQVGLNVGPVCFDPLRPGEKEAITIRPARPLPEIK